MSTRTIEAGRIVETIAQEATGHLLDKLRRIVSRQEEFVLLQVKRSWPEKAEIRIPFRAEWREAFMALLLIAVGEGRTKAKAEIAKRRRSVSRTARVREARRKPATGIPAVQSYAEWARSIETRAFRELVDEVEPILTDAMKKSVSLEDYWVYEDGKRVGEKQPGLLTQLGEVFEDAQGYELERKARTEYTRATSLGALYEYREDPMVSAVEFVAVMDSRTSDICAMMNGTVFHVDDPQLARHSPPLHVNCRSALIPRMIGEGIIPNAYQKREYTNKETGEYVKFAPVQIRTDFKAGLGNENLSKRVIKPFVGRAEAQQMADVAKVVQKLGAQA
jgi:SPP1 gp7 family putative phage head morphogenesis protein